MSVVRFHQLASVQRNAHTERENWVIITFETTRIDTHLNSFLVKLERELRIRGLSEVQIMLWFLRRVTQVWWRGRFAKPLGRWKATHEFESHTLHCSTERIIIIMVAIVPHIAESVMITNVVANCRTFHWTGALDVQWNGLVFLTRTVNQAATIADCKSAPNWVRWFESITVHWCKALHQMDSCSYYSDLLSIKDCM